MSGFIFTCFNCNKVLETGEGERIEGKLLCKKCEDNYWKWIKDNYEAL